MYDMCLNELLIGHKLILFRFSQKDTINLCVNIYNHLLSFTNIPDDEEIEKMISDFCREYNIYRYEFKTVYNNDKKLYALYNGITFHNASMPESIRSAIENELLGSPKVIRNGIRIVVATETLAYGLNGNVDTVIMTTMLKHEKDQKNPVTYNTYHNCIGRSGRLGYVDSGTAYTFLPAELLYKDQKMKTPEQIIRFYSRTVSDCHEINGAFGNIVKENDKNNFAFYLLNLMQNKICKLSDLTEMVLSVPSQFNYDPTALKRLIVDSVRFLKNEDMLSEYSTEDEETEENITGYYVTGKGKKYQAYAISIKDYKKIGEIFEKCGSDSFYIADYLIELTGIRSILKKSMHFIVSPQMISDKENNLFYIQLQGLINLKNYVLPLMTKRKHISYDMQREIESALHSADTQIIIEKPLYEKLVEIKSLLIAYMWIYGADAEIIDRIVGWSDETILNIRRDIGEKMSYYTDIAGVSAVYSSVTDDTKKCLKYLSLALFYGINFDWLKKYDLYEFNNADDAAMYHALSVSFCHYQYAVETNDIGSFKREFELLEPYQQKILLEEGVNIESL